MRLRLAKTCNSFQTSLKSIRFGECERQIVVSVLGFCRSKLTKLAFSGAKKWDFGHPTLKIEITFCRQHSPNILWHLFRLNKPSGKFCHSLTVLTTMTKITTMTTETAI